jgi:hypothetical protein
MVTQYLYINYREFPLFKQLHSTVLFRQLQRLKFQHLDDKTHILPYLGPIKDLAIWDTRIPAYSVDIYLACVHTLQKLELKYSTYSWMVGRTFHTLKECTVYNWEGLSGDLSAYKGVQVHMPACTKFKWWGNALAYTLFSHPNVQMITLRRLDTPDEALLKSLQNLLSNCPCLQELRIRIEHCSGVDSLIQFIFCNAQEQGVWRDIRIVELEHLSIWSGRREQDKRFNKIVRQTQHYEKCWKELTVSQGGYWTYERITLRGTK